MAAQTPLPFPYLHALNNRLSAHEIKLRYTPQLYPPIFVYDLLMLPGTLSAVLNKPSSSTLAARMTPATLPGYRARVVAASGLPAAVRVRDSNDGAGDGDGGDDGGEEVVEGMLLFGHGARNRRMLREREMVDVVLAGGERVEVKAHVFVWAAGEEGLLGWDGRGWAVGRFLLGWYTEWEGGVVGEEEDWEEFGHGEGEGKGKTRMAKGKELGEREEASS
ncbi:hypothetical protein LTR66_002391 [Elasticomyces elasticus]|nr:hypothetical protein LTR66_002391 [Elasticomyces elasticus]